METIENLLAQIDAALKSVKDCSDFMARLQPVTFRVKGSNFPFIGIARVVIDNKEQKNLADLLNKPLWKGVSFLDMFYNMQNSADGVSKLVVELQSQLSPTDPLYYGKANEVVDAYLTLFKNWYNYSFDAVNESIEIPGYEGKGALGITAEYGIKEKLLRMDMTEDLKQKCKLPK